MNLQNKSNLLRYEKMSNASKTSRVAGTKTEARSFIFYDHFVFC